MIFLLPPSCAINPKNFKKKTCYSVWDSYSWKKFVELAGLIYMSFRRVISKVFVFNPHS
jgi:hypothetical protein